MRWDLMITVALAATLVTAGCIGNSGNGEDVSPTAEDDAAPDVQAGNGTGNASALPTSPVTVHRLNVTWTAEVYNSGIADGDRGIWFDVPAGADAIVTELRWTGTSDMDLWMQSPIACQDAGAPEPVFEGACSIRAMATGSGEGVHGTDRASPAVQDASLRIEIDSSTIEEESCDQPPCEWMAGIHPNVAADTTAMLRVTVFDGTTPSEGYSAFDEET